MVEDSPIYLDKKTISLPWLVFSLTAIAYLLIGLGLGGHQDEYFYLFSVLHHSPSELVELELGLSGGILPDGYGIFPQGFFSGKIGFITLLRFLVEIFGSGLWSLFFIEFIFALMMIGCVAASYGLLREILKESEAVNTAIVLMFLPVTIFLDYKVLSEVPSLLCITLGCWAFLRSFRIHNRWQIVGFMLLAMTGLLLGILCRFTSFLFFGGLVLGVFVLGDERYHWTTVFKRASLLSICLLIVTLACYKLIGIPYSRFISIAMAVAHRHESLGVKIFNLMISVQLFLPVLILGVRPHWNAERRVGLFAGIWMSVCALPFVIRGHLEPRYLYMTLTPLAVLVNLGLNRLAVVTHLERHRKGWALLLAASVLGNRLFFAPLVPYEIDQYQYEKIMAEVAHRYPGAAYLIPWLSDYCFIRFAFPEQRVELSWSKPRSGGGHIFPNEAFRRWVEGEHYVGSLDELKRVHPPWLYLGWTYNPAVEDLKDRLSWLRVEYLKDVEKNEGLQNHLTLSWIWSDPALNLIKVARRGLYQAFEVQIK